jgi:hypothetical protein
VSVNPEKVTLMRWAKEGLGLNPPPPIRTLQRWAREGRICPGPEFIGREYRVYKDAVYVRQARKPRIQPIVVLKSEDPIVNDIISGPTQKRRQA